MERRQFLRLAGTFVATAGVVELLGACKQKTVVEPDAAFPQGVASGDPRPTSVVLWTRVEPALEIAGGIDVTVELATDTYFTSPVLRQTYRTNEQSDYTLRVIAQDLQPDTVYYYRFIVEDHLSRVGRTWTAPTADAATPVSFAFVSCQDYAHGYFTAYRKLIEEDLAREPDARLRFILHLGDFIYETRNESYHEPIDDELQPLAEPLQNRDGSLRTIDAFPDGGVTATGIQFALTTADYRALYRRFLSDPDLQDARARWPFIHTWDDHEFSDDCWQSEANYQDRGADSSTDEPSQPRRVAANQAWFEYTPVNLTALDDVAEELRAAREFVRVDVETTANSSVNANNQANNGDNLAAIHSLTLYRHFHFGQFADLIVTDNRSYRSDHAIPEDLSGNYPLFLHPRAALPLDMVNALDAGRTANDGDPDLLLFVGEYVFNPRYSRPPGTMLGPEQKTWWKNVMAQSTTRWRLWGNSVPAMRFKIDVSNVVAEFPDVIMSSDTWDGYRSERNELMSFLQEQRIANVISLAGDVHAHFAGVVQDDHDGIAPAPCMVEFVTASISSMSQFAAVAQIARRDEPTATEALLGSLITYDARAAATPGTNTHVENLNTTLRFGAQAASAVAQSNTVAAVNDNRNDALNPHLRYADTAAHGFGIVNVAAEEVTTELVTLDSIINAHVGDVGILRRARFVVPRVEDVTTMDVSAPTITGVAPFPLDLGVS